MNQEKKGRLRTLAGPHGGKMLVLQYDMQALNKYMNSFNNSFGLL